MPRIRCHYVDCVFLDEGYCAAAAVELDSEEGCLTYAAAGEVSAEDAWDDNEALEDEWEEAGFGPDEDEDEEEELEEEEDEDDIDDD